MSFLWLQEIIQLINMQKRSVVENFFDNTYILDQYNTVALRHDASNRAAGTGVFKKERRYSL